jgi:hypothetical protein
MAPQNDTSATASALASAIAEGQAEAVANSLAEAWSLGGASAEATSAAVAQAYNQNPGTQGQGVMQTTHLDVDGQSTHICSTAGRLHMHH